MTIKRGVAWGVTFQAPEDFVSVSSDAELGICAPSDFVSLLGGDLFCALGSPVPVLPRALCTLVNIDALICVVQTKISEVRLLSASSVVAGSWWTRSGFVCLTNGGLMNGRDLTPRAHPNDGKWDVLRIHDLMNKKQRVIARRRAKTGSHIPHPQIDISRTDEITIRRTSQRQTLKIDGVRIPNWTSVHCHVSPDYWQVLV